MNNNKLTIKKTTKITAVLKSMKLGSDSVLAILSTRCLRGFTAIMKRICKDNLRRRKLSLSPYITASTMATTHRLEARVTKGSNSRRHIEPTSEQPVRDEFTQMSRNKKYLIK